MSNFFWWWFKLTQLLYRDARRIEKEGVLVSAFFAGVFFLIYPFMPKQYKDNAFQYLIQHL